MTDSMRIGRDAHSDVDQVRVRSGDGVALLDMIVKDNDIYVIVEKKAFRSSSIHRYVVQLVSQYLVALNKFSGIRRVVLVNGDDKREFELSSDLVEEVKLLINRMEKSLESDKPPPPTTDVWRCTICWYRRFCPYS